MDSLTAKLKALSDPTRRAIVEILRTGNQSVTSLAERFAVSRPAVSKHLGILRDAGLVSAQRDGRQQIYRLVVGSLNPVTEWFEVFLSGEARRTESRPAPRRTRRPAGRDDWRSW